MYENIKELDSGLKSTEDYYNPVTKQYEFNDGEYDIVFMPSFVDNKERNIIITMFKESEKYIITYFSKSGLWICDRLESEDIEGIFKGLKFTSLMIKMFWTCFRRCICFKYLNMNIDKYCEVKPNISLDKNVREKILTAFNKWINVNYNGTYKSFDYVKHIFKGNNFEMVLHFTNYRKTVKFKGGEKTIDIAYRLLKGLYPDIKIEK